MRRLKRTLLAAALIGAVSFSTVGQSSTVAFAHGHHGGGHCGSNTNYYYCGGHRAHMKIAIIIAVGMMRIHIQMEYVLMRLL